VASPWHREGRVYTTRGGLYLLEALGAWMGRPILLVD